jgi:hypothetical protein
VQSVHLPGHAGNLRAGRLHAVPFSCRNSRIAASSPPPIPTAARLRHPGA